jgi:hypothetical protein
MRRIRGERMSKTVCVVQEESSGKVGITIKNQTKNVSRFYKLLSKLANTRPTHAVQVPKPRVWEEKITVY